MKNLLSVSMKYLLETLQARHNLKLAGITNRTRLLLSKEEANHEWEMRSLETSPKVLKYFSFVMFSAPIVVTIVSPTVGTELWNNLALVPDWFQGAWITINGTVWGISALKDSGVTLSSLK